MTHELQTLALAFRLAPVFYHYEMNGVNNEKQKKTTNKSTKQVEIQNPNQNLQKSEGNGKGFNRFRLAKEPLEIEEHEILASAGSTPGDKNK